MQTYKSNVPAGTQASTLTNIKGIKFTAREVDIIACLLSGRSSKAIGAFLTIEEKTVETHKYNIMRKLECSSRESIRDFIEKSGKFLDIKNHYVDLLVRTVFKQRSRDILTLRAKDSTFSIFFYKPEKEYKLPFLQKLEECFKLVGASLLLETRETYKSVGELIHKLESQEIDCIIYALSKSSIKQLQVYDNKAKSEISQLIQRAKQTPGSVIFLLEDQDIPIEVPLEISDINYINFGPNENHYFIALEIFKRLLSNINIEKIITEFEKEYQKIVGSFESSYLQMWEEASDTLEKDSIKNSKSLWQVGKARLLTGFVLCLSILVVVLLIGNSYKVRVLSQLTEIQGDKPQPLHSVRADLPIPGENAFLERPELITQIEEKLKRQEGIQTLAIIGIGGAGKTTLVRQYIRSQKSSIIWEINAATRGSFINSFENLAYALSKTEEEKKILRGLQDIKDLEQRVGKIILLVKEKLNSQPNWILIYDNVEKFSDIQTYFPSDVSVWGKGKVIIISRNNNIQNNAQINNTIQIGKLTSKQKLDLFIKIMGNIQKNPPNLFQREQSNNFLKDIPPFPLDVAVAAYYIKATNISYEKYLEYLKQPNNEFEDTQKNILKEACEYCKTRYSIITLSLKQLIDTHKNFGQLILFISLLDSQNIPRDLLECYRNNSTVDDFVYNVKKYSLLINEPPPFNQKVSHTFSIHRNIQAICLTYMMQVLKLDSQQLKFMVDALVQYISNVMDQGDYNKMKLMVNHGERFLSHLPSTAGVKDIIATSLGAIYYQLGHCVKAQGILEETLQSFNTYKKKPHKHIAEVLMYLGGVYIELGYFEKAETVLKEALDIYENYFSQEIHKIADVLIFLGWAYKDLGKYNQAKASLERSLNIYTTHYPHKYHKIAGILDNLGIIYLNVGEYKKAKILLEKSLTIYKRYYPENHMDIAEIVRDLGRVYGEFGQYTHAKALLEKNLEIYKKYYPEDHNRMSWTLLHLGRMYRELGEYKKAKVFLEKSLIIYNKTFPEDNPRVGWASRELGVLYKKIGQYNQAKALLEKSLVIFQKHYGHDHIQVGSVLLELGHVNLLEGNISNAETLLHQSLKIFQKNNHPNSYISLENLTKLYLKKSTQAENKGNIQQSQNLKEQAIDYLKQALGIVKGHFPEESLHIKRIQEKLKTQPDLATKF